MFSTFVQRQTAGWEVIDHFLEVPLDHQRSNGQKISIYGREVRLADDTPRPWLLFLQGGPGGRSPRPTELSSWLRAATADYRVLLLDQRGTGRSTLANRQTLPLVGDAAAQAEYLTHFRADSIVRDAELFRCHLAGPDTKWSILGQSFGGFCSTTYLSFAPEGLDRVLITGGVPPLTIGPEDYYRTTAQKMLERNEEYFARYPEDQAALTKIADFVTRNRVELPCGDRLTAQRVQFLGLPFGMTDGYDLTHYLVEDAWAYQGELSDLFLSGVEQATSLTTNPLSPLMLDVGLCQGSASRWASSRVLDEFPEFSAPTDTFAFTGEMASPWMFQEYGVLRPLADTADLLAQYEDWPRLYDPDVLRVNDVPMAAVIYEEDLYVPREFSVVTARHVRGATAWVTSEFEHDGLRRHGERIFNALNTAAGGGLHPHGQRRD